MQNLWSTHHTQHPSWGILMARGPWGLFVADQGDSVLSFGEIDVRTEIGRGATSALISYITKVEEALGWDDNGWNRKAILRPEDFTRARRWMENNPFRRLPGS